jgi:hypothetical protein
MTAIKILEMVVMRIVMYRMDGIVKHFIIHLVILGNLIV